MPYPANFMLLAFGGNLYSGAEQWSMTLKSTPTVTVPGNQSEEQATLESIAPVLSAWFTGAQSAITPRATLNWAKWNLIGPDGKYANDYTNLYEWPTPPAGPASSNVYPPQISLVVTLLTARERGLASKGRVFLPVTGLSLGTDGRIAAATATSTATQFAALLGNLNSLPGYGATEICSNVGNGAQNVVTGVTCGRVLDTMRSRRTSLPEERVTPVAVAAGT